MSLAGLVPTAPTRRSSGRFLRRHSFVRVDSIFAPSPSARSARETAATKQRCAACGKRLMLTSYMLLAARPALATVADDVAADLAATSLANPGTSWALLNRTREVIYPAEFVGEWQVTARLSNVSFPLGQTYINKDVPGVTKSSLIAVLPDVGAGMDDAVTYRARYTRLGEGAIPDRTYNQRQLLNAFLGYEATQTVEYDRQANKTRFAVVYKTPRRDQREQSSDLRKAELFVNNCRFDARGSEFFSTEAIRQVNQARQSGFVYDYEIVQRWSGVGSQSMQSFVRVGAFLNPEAAGFFKSQGKAIALYDYELAFTKA